MVDRVMRDVEAMPPPAQPTLEELRLHYVMPSGCWGPTCVMTS